MQKQIKNPVGTGLGSFTKETRHPLRLPSNRSLLRRIQSSSFRLSPGAAILRTFTRTLLLMLIAAVGTAALVRSAPGFLSDEREIDARYAREASSDRATAELRRQTFLETLCRQAHGWLHGDLGESRQFNVPVMELLVGRIQTSASLLVCGISLGWVLAICAALPVSRICSADPLWRRISGNLLGLPATLLLATPTAAMATACILYVSSRSGSGGTGSFGPVLVLTLMVAARDFKFLSRVLREAWRAPHVLQGRAQGLRPWALLRIHILPNTATRLWALASLSIVTALAALIPVEVIFNVPGVGQMAWSGVMNRDLPVIAAVTVLMAAIVAVAGMLCSLSSAMPRQLDAA